MLQWLRGITQYFWKHTMLRTPQKLRSIVINWYLIMSCPSFRSTATWPSTSIIIMTRIVHAICSLNDTRVWQCTCDNVSNCDDHWGLFRCLIISSLHKLELNNPIKPGFGLLRMGYYGSSFAHVCCDSHACVCVLYTSSTIIVAIIIFTG